MKIKINFDGACRNIPGQNNQMGIGIAVFIDDVYRPDHSNAIHHEGRDGELGTSNISEWKGCVEAMRKACLLRLSCGVEKLDYKIEVYSDSQLITRQFNGEYEVKQDSFRKYYAEAKKLALRAGITKINWIPREQNKEADILSKQGLKEEV